MYMIMNGDIEIKVSGGASTTLRSLAESGNKTRQNGEWAEIVRAEQVYQLLRHSGQHVLGHGLYQLLSTGQDVTFSPVRMLIVFNKTKSTPSRHNEVGFVVLFRRVTLVKVVTDLSHNWGDAFVKDRDPRRKGLSHKTLVVLSGAFQRVVHKNHGEKAFIEPSNSHCNCGPYLCTLNDVGRQFASFVPPVFEESAEDVSPPQTEKQPGEEEVEASERAGHGSVASRDAAATKERPAKRNKQEPPDSVANQGPDTLDHNLPQQVPERVTRSNQSSTAHETVTCLPFTWDNLYNAICRQQPVVFEVGRVPSSKYEMQSILRSDGKQYRTSSGSRVTFAHVLDNESGILRLEEGVHDPEWEQGSVEAIMDTLFVKDSSIRKSWDLVKTLPTRFHITQRSSSSHVMTVTGNSTNIISACADFGGAAVNSNGMVVPCHQDDVENFTWTLWGRKTFLVDPPEVVKKGNIHASENPQADTTSSAFLKAVIEEGQMLFLPMLWWYQVHTNPEGCMTIGQWFGGRLQPPHK